MNSDRTERHCSELPMVTVVIPTRNRSEMLRAGLESLLHQSYPRDRYEVIVVDNGSTDGTKEMVETITAASNGLVRYLRQENLGPAVARNRGIQEGTGEILALTDSDCQAHPDWIREGVNALHADDKLGLISGKVIPVPGKEITLLTRTMLQERESPSYPSCNIFYRRETLDQVGVFDPRFGVFKYNRDYAIGGEDTDLGWRIKRAGWQTGFASEALIYHAVVRITALQKLLLDPGRYPIHAFLMKEIPELRQHAFLRYFRRPETALFDLGAVGMVLAAVAHPAFLALGLPFPCYIGWVHVRPYRSGRLAKFAFLNVYFAAISICLVYGSLKYRSLLL